MPGNEKNVVKFLLDNRLNIKLRHLGEIFSIKSPISTGQMQDLHTIEDVESFVKEDSKHKKADIYINDKGISIKQTGGSKAFNKFQRKSAIFIFNTLNIQNPHENLLKIDEAVKNFHEGKIKRDANWQDFFLEKDFKPLMKHLMMLGDQKKLSDFPADLILTSPKIPIISAIKTYTFDEYFEEKKDLTKVSIRRVWPSQDSKSESDRARSIAKVESNFPWVFENIAGTPNSGFKEDSDDNRTVYYLDISVID